MQHTHTNTALQTTWCGIIGRTVQCLSHYCNILHRLVLVLHGYSMMQMVVSEQVHLESTQQHVMKATEYIATLKGSVKFVGVPCYLTIQKFHTLVSRSYQIKKLSNIPHCSFVRKWSCNSSQGNNHTIHTASNNDEVWLGLYLTYILKLVIKTTISRLVYVVFDGK